jgi:hypothetical protein
MALENIFPPLPSEVIMPLAGFTAQQGKLSSLLWVVLAGSRAYRLNLYSTLPKQYQLKFLISSLLDSSFT